MKIKFTLFQVLLLVILILILYKFGPITYDAWFNPEYVEGYMTNQTASIRVISGVILFICLIPYLIVTEFRILTKKREINLTPWKSTN